MAAVTDRSDALLEDPVAMTERAAELRRVLGRVEASRAEHSRALRTLSDRLHALSRFERTLAANADALHGTKTTMADAPHRNIKLLVAYTTPSTLEWSGRAATAATAGVTDLAADLDRGRETVLDQLDRLDTAVTSLQRQARARRAQLVAESSEVMLAMRREQADAQDLAARAIALDRRAAEVRP